MSTEQRAASLLSLIASKALVPGGFANASANTRERSDGEIEDQRAQTMMYAARMKYLQESDGVKPDTMFMTRKQAQKLVKQDTISTITLKKLDVGGKSANGSANNDGKGMNGPNSSVPLNQKKQRWTGPLDDYQQVWVPVTQAGCHFWQSQETGECRSVPPAPFEGCIHPGIVRGEEDLDVNNVDELPFPQSFAFLDQKHS